MKGAGAPWADENVNAGGRGVSTTSTVLCMSADQVVLKQGCAPLIWYLARPPIALDAFMHGDDVLAG